MRRGPARWRALILGLVLPAAACGPAAAPAATAAPATPAVALPTRASPSAATTATPASPPPAAAPAPTTVPAPGAAIALEAPVLGGTRTAWVRARGDPTRGTQGEVFGGDAAVTFAPGPGGQERASRVDLLLGHAAGGDRGGVPVVRARELARPLHPPDARAVRTDAAEGGQAVEVFRSELLAEAFRGATRPEAGGSYFGEEPPGTYSQVAERDGPTSNRVVLAVGTGP